jgi:hypothetical protein
VVCVVCSQAPPSPGACFRSFAMPRCADWLWVTLLGLFDVTQSASFTHDASIPPCMSTA